MISAFQDSLSRLRIAWSGLQGQNGLPLCGSESGESCDLKKDSFFFLLPLPTKQHPTAIQELCFLGAQAFLSKKCEEEMRLNTFQLKLSPKTEASGPPSSSEGRSSPGPTRPESPIGDMQHRKRQSQSGAQDEVAKRPNQNQLTPTTTIKASSAPIAKGKEKVTIDPRDAGIICDENGVTTGIWEPIFQLKDRLVNKKDSALETPLVSLALVDGFHLPNDDVMSDKWSEDDSLLHASSSMTNLVHSFAALRRHLNQAHEDHNATLKSVEALQVREGKIRADLSGKLTEAKNEIGQLMKALAKSQTENQSLRNQMGALKNQVAEGRAATAEVAAVKAEVGSSSGP
ncbi:hypothetical protein HHK36_019929 [Tetracentron sinense]|uniref:Uncharacterized protein n=1 Tax=Tetracentron sinense TaxID=13715 RepID=A0A834YW79_TETSI|nr:hypothetical protein HHK36_019929 [Tetracentron sinense]